MQLPDDYAERVYAGVLGKIIGVYLGRPFEGWSHEQVVETFGEIQYYVNDLLGKPLIITDDDISGTFTFLRALPDNGNSFELTPEQIGQAWLNYIIEGLTILWWSGLGNSTEHTAYLRLKQGIKAPESGSAALNGKTTSEQIGAQIFIDGWAMVVPGEPALAADLARRAASVSHDGEGIYGAQVIAAMESQAFVERDIDHLIDTAVRFIPKDSAIYKVIDDVREWHSIEPDWKRARALLDAKHGYSVYGGNVPIVSNHGLIQLSLLYGDDDFQKTQMIVNTSGWDTDCNAGNVGCLMGIKNGLKGIDVGPNWRGPLLDRLFLSTADGGRAISDAVNEALHIVHSGHALAGSSFQWPKHGAQFNFCFPGSLQGFQPEVDMDRDAELILENVEGYSRLGQRSMAIRFDGKYPEAHFRALTPTFILPGELDLGTYELFASPTLYSGQIVRCGVAADDSNPYEIGCRLVIKIYGPGDCMQLIEGPETILPPGSYQKLLWKVPATGGAPIVKVGVAISNAAMQQGSAYLDYLMWDGAPDVYLGRPAYSGEMWRRAWVKAIDFSGNDWPESFRLAQNHGEGLLIQGSHKWRDYVVKSDITPHLVQSVGICAYVQGLHRYYGLVLDDGVARLVKAHHTRTVLAEKKFPWDRGKVYEMELEVVGNHLNASIDRELLFCVDDNDVPLKGGGVALLCREGCLSSNRVVVKPVKS